MDSIQMENNFPAEFLSQAHYDFLVGYLEFERVRDAAILSQFLREKI
jgi:hypothetical protein